jgi:hypothetical protein
MHLLVLILVPKLPVVLLSDGYLLDLLVNWDSEHTAFSLVDTNYTFAGGILNTQILGDFSDALVEEASALDDLFSHSVTDLVVATGSDLFVR